MSKKLRCLQFTIYLFILTGFTSVSIISGEFEIMPVLTGLCLIVVSIISTWLLKRYYPTGDRVIFLVVILLSSIGLIMLTRLEKASGIKQGIWLLIGITAFLVIVIFFKKGLIQIAKLRYLFLVATILFMGLATFFGTEIYGAKNWILIGPISFQPSEFGKIFLILYLASALSQGHSFKKLMEPGIVVVISLGFMMLQRDLGTALMIFAISVTLVYLATSKRLYVIIALGLFILGGTASAAIFSHVRQRFVIWLDPWPYIYNESYQVVQSMYAIATGGMFGTGLGFGHPEYVAVNQSDFIFSVICEEMGLFMGFAILILNFILFYRCIRSSILANNNFTKLLTAGLSVMLATQTLVIVGGVTGFLPLTGITLPFVSYGGTSILICYLAISIIFKISEGERDISEQGLYKRGD